uniref:Dirigent protein n=2 Tax=Triticum urartu TaxID=4572 RepID=A0A8R7TC85_TRIUA
MTLYYHDILYDDINNTENATSAAATKPTVLSTTHWKNDTYFGTLVVFDDPMTVGKVLPMAGEGPAARAQGFYFYDKQESYTSWFGFSIVFNSTAHKGTINLVGVDLMDDKTRGLSVVGGTGHFFMARGIATLRLDASEGTVYFCLQMDIKLYECYV